MPLQVYIFFSLTAVCRRVNGKKTMDNDIKSPMSSMSTRHWVKYSVFRISFNGQKLKYKKFGIFFEMKCLSEELFA